MPPISDDLPRDPRNLHLARTAIYRTLNETNQTISKHRSVLWTRLNFSPKYSWNRRHPGRLANSLHGHLKRLNYERSHRNQLQFITKKNSVVNKPKGKDEVRKERRQEQMQPDDEIQKLQQTSKVATILKTNTAASESTENPNILRHVVQAYEKPFTSAINSTHNAVNNNNNNNDNKNSSRNQQSMPAISVPTILNPKANMSAHLHPSNEEGSIISNLPQTSSVTMPQPGNLPYNDKTGNSNNLTDTVTVMKINQTVYASDLILLVMASKNININSDHKASTVKMDKTMVEFCCERVSPMIKNTYFIHSPQSTSFTYYDISFLFTVSKNKSPLPNYLSFNEIHEKCIDLIKSICKAVQ